MAMYPDALKQLLEFIWQKLNADTIRIDLYHFALEAEGQLKANAEIKEALVMKKLGFKWKTLINDPETGGRYQVMQMNRPKDLPKKAQRQEPITIKSALLLRMFKDAGKIAKTDIGTQPIEVPYNYLSALSQLKKDKQVSSLSNLNEGNGNTLASQVDQIPDTLQLQGVRATVNTDKNEAMKDTVT